MRKAIAVTILAISFCYCFGQSTNSKPVEPTVIGDVFLLDSSTQTLKPLPSEPWQETTTHMGALSGGYMHSVQLPGNQSTFRLRAEEKAEFVFKVGNPENVTLYPCVQKKHQRLANYAKDQLHANWTADKTSIAGLPVEITQFGDSSFKLAPKASLGPGEYVISTSTKMFSFGIDK